MNTERIRLSVNGADGTRKVLTGDVVIEKGELLEFSREDLAARGWTLEDYRLLNADAAIVVEYLNGDGRPLSKSEIRSRHKDELVAAEPIAKATTIEDLFPR